MADVNFVDGFDLSEPLLCGLIPVQLGAIVGGVALGYLAFRSSLPCAAGVAMAIFLAAGAVGVGTLHIEGRTLIAWLGSAGRFHGRRRGGLMLIASGAADVVSLAHPSAGPELLRAESTARSNGWGGPCRGGAPHGSRVVFFSLAGGSGLTTLAVEVAAILADGRGAALLDLNLLCPRTGLRLGVPLSTDWPEFVATGAAWQLSVRHPCGLRVVPGPAETDDGRLAEDSRLLVGLEVILRRLESECRTVVLDIRAGLGAVTRWALDAADIIAVVLTPTAGGLQDAYRSTAVLRRLGHARKLRYVVNRGTDASLFEEAMADLGGTVVGCVPEDPELTRAEAEHRLISAGVGPTARSLRLLAARLVAPVQPEAAPALRVAPLLGAPPRRERAG